MNTEEFRNLINGINDREPLAKWIDDLQVHLNDLLDMQPRAVSAGGEEGRKLRMPISQDLTEQWLEIVRTRIEEIEGA